MVPQRICSISKKTFKIHEAVQKKLFVLDNAPAHPQELVSDDGSITISVTQLYYTDIANGPKLYSHHKY